MANIQTRVMNVLRSFKKQGISKKDLARRAGVKPNQKKQYQSALDELGEQKKLAERGGRYYPLDEGATVPGVIVKVTATFGFARPEGAESDVFVPGRMLHGALPGDKVQLRVRRSRGDLPEGEVTRIDEQASRPITGVLVKEEGRSFVQPDHSLGVPVRVGKHSLGGAKAGDKVLVEITERGKGRMDHLGKIREVFGSADSAAACCKAVLAENEIPIEFPEEVLEQARQIAEAGIHPKEIGARTDLRDKLIFTIDGADTKDIDDAVSLEALDDGYELGVHIADVSHYVRQNTPLDVEAMRRGTSVYYADSVVPMLPEALSNGICSLNPGEDRLAFSALVRLDRNAHIQDYRFVKTVIRSRVKGVYSELNAILDGSADEALRSKYRDVEGALRDMAALYEKLTKNRAARGSLELDSAEGKIVLDEKGVAVDVVTRERGVCERLIEEFMLTANEAAAALALKRDLPFVYRVHDDPSPDRLQMLYDVLDRLGVSYDRVEEDVTRTLSAAVAAVRGTPFASVVNTLTLRSMAKAKYLEQCTGHFGLKLEKYAHFTSPIRRYPDLTIHRVLSAHVTGMKDENLRKRYTAFCAESAAQSTARELAAMKAERDCEDRYKAEYMRRFVGEEFDGVISSTTAFGAYVQLPNTVEGLVRIARFPYGDWEFDGQIGFVDRVGNGRMQLGDAVHIKVLGVDVSAGQIDFAMDIATAGEGE